jgi:hypothetical protein
MWPVILLDPRVPVIAADVLVATATPVAVKVTELWPAATVTEDGIVTPIAGPLFVSVTTRPPVGAALDRVKVPVDEAPPTTVLGENPMLIGNGAVT